MKIALQLFAAKSAVESYLKLPNRDNIPRLNEIHKLNSDLEEAQTKLTELIENRNSSFVTDLNNDVAKYNSEYDNQKKIDELDQMWRSKITQLFNLEDLKERASILLNINI